MVSRRDDLDSGCRYVIRPNRSLTWPQTQLFFALMATVSLTVASGFALLGYWPVLPFAGAELLALWFCLWLCATGGAQVQVVRVRGDTISVEKGRRGPVEVWHCPRAWAQILLVRARSDWYPSRLIIRSHGREVGIGEFLSEDERCLLARELRRMVASTPHAGPG